MSCLQVSVSVLPLSLRPKVSRHDTPINLKVSDVSNHLKVTCGIVCSIGDVHYLRVSPEEVQWITPDTGIIYTVESDTNWSILVN